MPPVIDKNLCNACGICWDVCPQDVFTFENRKEPPEIGYPKECWYCGACYMDCPKEAIRLKLPLQLHIVPSPALYGPPKRGEEENLRKAAAFTRSVIKE
ncbi:MAG: ferredoxin [Spirochaetes bacterium]|nr:MAG: ferredoxin [Spirochaetota bacterium]